MSPRGQGRPAAFAKRGPTLRWGTPAALPATLLATTAMKPAPLAKTATSTTSPRAQGQLALFVQLERSRPREMPPVALVMPPAKPAIKLRLPASPATSTMNPRGQDPPARPASWGLSPLSETPPAHPATYLVMVVMELPPHVKIVLSTTSPRGQGRLAQSAQMEHFRPRETLPVVLVILPVRLATKHQLPA